ncbi:DUF5004 domain-containing protein [Niabella sp. CJ426]|uniref:DUF5004 domain-containing protein n=1 Tax=Niabella sp. CJ426 TaxID=3393740 RepID=UPI003CFCC8FB
MKLKNIFLFTASFILLLAAACKKEAYKPVNEISNKTLELEGDWKVTKVILSDLDAIESNFPYKELDVTNTAPFTTSTLKLVKASDTGGTFTSSAGTAPFFLPLSAGSWELDDPNSPTTLTIKGAASTFELPLGSLVLLKTKELQFKILKKLDGVSVIAYTYFLTKS